MGDFMMTSQKFSEDCSSDEVGYCPKCGRPLSAYSHIEGGWCEHCQEWFPDDIVQERMEEEQ